MTETKMIEKPKFHLHEVLDLRGGKFRLTSFGKKMIVLEALPGTNVEPDNLVKQNLHLKNIAQETYVERQKLLGLVIALLKKFVGPGTDLQAEVNFKEATELSPDEHLDVKPEREDGKIIITLRTKTE